MSLDQRIEALVTRYFTSQTTQELLVDDNIMSYLKTIFTSCDYSNKEVLTSILRTCAPILQNFRLFGNLDEASEYLNQLFEAILREVPQLRENTLNSQIISIAAKVSEAQQLQAKSKQLQASRDLYQQTMDYQMQKHENRALTQQAKRILKGKSTLEKELGHVYAERLEQRAQGEEPPQEQQGKATVSDAVGKQGVSGRGIILQSASISFGANTLLSNVNFTFSFGHRYCLVARNGAGKSTLLRAIYDDDLRCIPDRDKLKIAFVRQEVPSGQESALDVVLQSDSTYRKLNKLYNEIEVAQATYIVSEQLACEVELLLGRKVGGGPEEEQHGAEVSEVELLEAQYKLLSQMEEYGCSALEEHAKHVLQGLGFSGALMRRPTCQLSGGWRSRAALAQALFQDPDILLLDEPTNNLDLQAVLWLEKWLGQFSVSKLLIVVSHDTAFIDEVATDVVLLSNKQLKLYSGCNYTRFAESRSAELQNQQKAAARIEMRKKHIQSFVDRFRVNAKRASLVQSRLKTLSKIQDVQLSAEAPAAFELPSPYEPGSEPEPFNMIELEGVDFSHANSQGQSLLGSFRIKSCSLLIKSDSRVAIVGANAAGKSTVLKLIAGTLKPSAGTITRAHEAVITAFWQHHQDQLNMNISPVEQLSTLVSSQLSPKEANDKVRSHLARFGIQAEIATRPIKTLSGGQRTRVTLALLTFGTTPTVLILDEPTNHLDIETKDALIDALQLYNGALIVVSHDGPFITAVADQLYVMDGGVLSAYSSDFETYREEVRASIK